MYHKSRMPLFDYLFTVRLLRNSIYFYTHHTGVLTSVDTFRDTALQVRGFFLMVSLRITQQTIRWSYTCILGLECRFSINFLPEDFYWEIQSNYTVIILVFWDLSMVFSIMHSNWLDFFNGSVLKYLIKYKTLLDMYHRSKMPFFD